jgi:uncharacterized membrane protein YhhN
MILAFAFACAFFLTRPLSPYPFAFAVKSGGILILALVSFLSGAPRAKILALGLLFGAGGDIALEQRQFELGLTSFLIGHLVYLGLFLQIIREHGSRSGWPRSALLILPIFALGLLAFLWPGLQDLAAPVTLYLAVIMIMTALAVLAPFNTIRVAIGAISFVVSDSLIAINKFVGGFAYVEQVIWALYFLAQYLILTGFLQGWQRHDESTAVQARSDLT